MVKIPEAHQRLFERIFVCRRCGAKIRALPKAIAEGKVRCRQCKGKRFRPKSKKLAK